MRTKEIIERIEEIYNTACDGLSSYNADYSNYCNRQLKEVRYLINNCSNAKEFNYYFFKLLKNEDKYLDICTYKFDCCLISDYMFKKIKEHFNFYI